MEKKKVLKIGFYLLVLMTASCLLLGCQQQAPPPAQTPAPSGTVQPSPQAGSAQGPAPVGSVQTPAPAGSVQTPAPAVSSSQMPPGGSAQMPSPAMTGTTPTQDINQIMVGMTPEQVQQIMGPPADLYQKGFIEWKYPNTSQGKVDIRFQNNKVIKIEKYTKQ